jgi:hypothetical protein
MEITRVKTKKDLYDFILLPWKIYKNYPNWVPPLISEVKEILDTQKYPFWEHARRELFLAKDSKGEVVGRIAGIVDENHNKYHNEKMGFFGFFECVNDYSVAEKLLDAARDYVKSQGMTHFRGPVNPSMNDECALLIEGFDMPPTIMMPYNPPYYVELLEKYGLRKIKDLYAFIKDKPGIPEVVLKLIERYKRRENVVIRQIDMRNLKREAIYLREVYNDAWADNWGFVPMTEKEMDYTIKKLKPIAEPSLVLFAEVRGKVVGAVASVPDINEVLKHLNGRLGIIGALKFLYYRKKITKIRSIIGGIKREFRGSGLFGALYYHTEINGLKLGYRCAELGWNLEDNRQINEFEASVGARIYKKYRIFEMQL